MKDIRKALLLACFFALTAFQEKKYDYDFKIAVSCPMNEISDNITVKIVNNENGKITLSNLVFKFMIDNDGFWGKPNLTDQKFLLKSKQKGVKSISFQSLMFADYQGNAFPVNNLKKKIKTSKLVILSATISDLRILADNPTLSSSLVSSNTIILKKEE